MEDPLIPGGLGESQDPFTNGLFIAGLTEDQLKAYGLFMLDFYERLSKKKLITRNAYNLINGAIFALGTERLNNIEWKQHCASSLREIVLPWDGDGQLICDFIEVYKIQKTNEAKPLLKRIYLLYKFFTGINHHEPFTVDSTVRAIKGDPSLQTSYCHQDGVFIENIKEFFVNYSRMIELSMQGDSPYEPNRTTS